MTCFSVAKKNKEKGTEADLSGLLSQLSNEALQVRGLGSVSCAEPGDGGTGCRMGQGDTGHP